MMKTMTICFEDFNNEQLNDSNLCSLHEDKSAAGCQQVAQCIIGKTNFKKFIGVTTSC
jgi:hypothetical protein